MRLRDTLARWLRVHSPSGHWLDAEHACWCRQERFKLIWGPLRLVRVKSARDHRWPRLYCNTYPGCWIGLALYYRQDGLSWLWGRPGVIRPSGSRQRTGD